MAQYCVNRNAQLNGDHEVHILNGTCNRLPTPMNQQPLGDHQNCASAVRAAKTFYPQSNGCWYCSPTCHTS